MSDEESDSTGDHVANRMTGPILKHIICFCIEKANRLCFFYFWSKKRWNRRSLFGLCGG